jgi:hypothetical protein
VYVFICILFIENSSLMVCVYVLCSNHIQMETVQTERWKRKETTKARVSYE